jgi:Zn-dependent protease with chaperone function
MIEIRGQLYDGKTSAETEAVCRVYDNGILRLTHPVTEETIVSAAGVDAVRFSPRLADTPRYLYFPGGEKFETADNDAVYRLLRRHRKKTAMDVVHLLESRRRYVLAALAIMMLFLAGAVRYGVPAAARAIAFRLPAGVMETAARQTMTGLDRTVFRPSTLDRETRHRLLDHFRPLLQDHRRHGLTVTFRAGGRVGPNAFALPDGTVVFTDQMVEMAEDDDELLAVLAHEAGHVVHRHGIRRVVQDSLLAFALMAATGDASGTSELFYGMPVMLTELAYSRQFEREADRYALDYLRHHGLPTAPFARLMRRIERRRTQERGGESNRRWTDYLSTHPATEERLKAFDP